MKPKHIKYVKEEHSDGEIVYKKLEYKWDSKVGELKRTILQGFCAQLPETIFVLPSVELEISEEEWQEAYDKHLKSKTYLKQDLTL